MRCSQLFVGFSAQRFGRSLGGSDGLDALVQNLRRAVLDGHDHQPERPWFPDQLEADSAAAADSRGVAVPESVTSELGWF